MHAKRLWKSFLLASSLGSLQLLSPVWAQPTWSNYAGNAQHTALSGVASQKLDRIIWQTPVDLQPQYSGTTLYIHYGSPLVTSANTVVVPVKTGATDGFRVRALSGSNGSEIWHFDSDYTLPAHGWTPSYSPTLTPTGRLYMPGAGGTLYYRDSVDSAGPITPTQIAFYGNGSYAANQAIYNSGVQVCTPLTSDGLGNVYFGYRTTGTILGLNSGIARVAANGTTTFISSTLATGGAASQVVLNCAPALSNDGSTVYIAMGAGTGYTSGYLVALDSTTLATKSQVLLKDPKSGNNALLADDGTASPTIAPDGSVYFGVLENPFKTSKGWLLHFNANLSVTGTPGAFGWDDTASLVPSSMVPSYSGSSSYLLMTKYNNYAGVGGGNGINKLAILDPNATQIDPLTGATVMKEVLTIAGPTPDLDHLADFPNAVREWCINTAVVDPFTGTILANSEDGKLYRWNLTSNTFTEVITLTAGIGEAYTPTLIGRDGKVYAINNATLFAVGTGPEPTTLLLLLCGLIPVFRRFSR